MSEHEKATPRPWKANGCYIEGPGSLDKTVAVAFSDSDKPAIANASLIVAAVNSYDASRARIGELEEDIAAKQVRLEMQVAASRKDAERIAALEQQWKAQCEETQRWRERAQSGDEAQRLTKINEELVNTHNAHVIMGARQAERIAEAEAENDASRALIEQMKDAWRAVRNEANLQEPVSIGNQSYWGRLRRTANKQIAAADKFLGVCNGAGCLRSENPESTGAPEAVSYQREDSRLIFNRTKPTKWDIRFLRMAREVASWSKDDPSTQTGAVIVSPDRRKLYHGYNGFPQAMHDNPTLLATREEKYSRIIHCEMNAALLSGANLKNHTLYTWPFASCDRCAVHMIQAGITEFVFPSLPPDKADRWKASLDKTLQYFQECRVRWLEIDHAAIAWAILQEPEPRPD